MSLINDNGKSLTLGVVNLFINDRELLQSSDNDTLSCIQCITKILRRFFLINCAYRAKRMIKARNRLLQLCVQVAAVSDNDHGGENRLIRSIMQ